MPSCDSTVAASLLQKGSVPVASVGAQGGLAGSQGVRAAEELASRLLASPSNGAGGGRSHQTTLTAQRVVWFAISLVLVVAGARWGWEVGALRRLHEQEVSRADAVPHGAPPPAEHLLTLHETSCADRSPGALETGERHTEASKADAIPHGAPPAESLLALHSSSRADRSPGALEPDERHTEAELSIPTTLDQKAPDEFRAKAESWRLQNSSTFGGIALAAASGAPMVAAGAPKGLWRLPWFAGLHTNDTDATKGTPGARNRDGANLEVQWRLVWATAADEGRRPSSAAVGLLMQHGASGGQLGTAALAPSWQSADWRLVWAVDPGEVSPISPPIETHAVNIVP